MTSVVRIVGPAVLLVLLAGAPLAAQTPASVDGEALEQVCLENAPDEGTRETCLTIVRTVLAPGGTLVLPAGPDASPAGPDASPAGGQGVGTTQATSTLLVTLLAIEWEAALFPREDVDVVAAEVAFESTHPEAYVDLGGLRAIDAEGFSHTWGAIHQMGDGPPGGFRAEGRRQRGWVGFEVPASTERIELEYQGTGGERVVWIVER